MTARVCIAQIGAAHGVRGEVRLKAFTEDPLSVARYGALESEDGKRHVEIEALRPGKNMLVARLKGVTDRDAAEALKNVRLYVGRERLPKPADDEFYHADLIGLAAVRANGETIGTVKAVHNFGAGDLLEIDPASGATMIVPFNATAVPVVDITGRRIVVELPADDAGHPGQATRSGARAGTHEHPSRKTRAVGVHGSPPSRGRR